MVDAEGGFGGVKCGDLGAEGLDEGGVLGVHVQFSWGSRISRIGMDYEGELNIN